MKKLALVAVSALFAFNVMAAEGTVTAPSDAAVSGVSSDASEVSTKTTVRKANRAHGRKRHASKEAAPAAGTTTAEPAPEKAPTH